MNCTACSQNGRFLNKSQDIVIKPSTFSTEIPPTHLQTPSLLNYLPTFDPYFHYYLRFPVAQRRNVKEIRQLENEVGRWNVLVDSVTGVCPGELDSQTLAVLRGRMVRYLMRSREISIGRSGKGHMVDIDLSLEGPAHKISRRQATLR